MITFPCSKINIGLNIRNKRADGFHNLDTVFVPVRWNDILEVVVSQNAEQKFVRSGINIPGKPDEDICIKARDLMRYKHGIPLTDIYLHKIIPTGAGLGGGSSDAAFVLKTINKLFSLGLSDNVLKEYALTLGSDCPFFINPEISYATGRGEELKPIDVNFKGYHIVIVKPNIHISTAMAFSLVTPDNTRKALNELVCNNNISDWKELIFNDFEEALSNHYPFIREIKDILYANNAIYASLSGSGSAVYGIFAGHVPDNISELFPGLRVWSGEL